MSERHALDARAVGLMTMLCLIWGLQQVALKVTASDFSPLLQIALRSGVGALLVGAFMRLRGERMSMGDGLWKAGFVVGGLFALEYLFVGEGLRYTSAAHMVVFLYTGPIFAALGLHWALPAERLRAVQWIGIGLAFGGIAMAFLLRGLGTEHELAAMLWGDFLGLLGGAAWGATTVVIRTTRLAALPATQTLQYQLVAAFALLMPAALIGGHTTFIPGTLVWVGFAYQCLAMSFVSYLVWFWLMRRYLASPLGVLSFMTPLFGVILGAWLLDEVIEPSFLLGAGLVIAGIVLVSAGGKVRRAGA